MYARLWWKDARQFWPIGVFLILAAAGTQGLVLHQGGPEARTGILGLLALGWTSLYAVAVGAAAFAGERETGTLRLLDTLPASRAIVWTGKVSFAVGTTLALGLILLAMAATGTDRWAPYGDQSIFGIGILLGATALQALGLTLFCSSILSNALLAAVAGIVITGLGGIPVMAQLDEIFRGRYPAEVEFQLVEALAALAASLLAFTWARRPRGAPLGLRLQSPIVVAWEDSPRPRPSSSSRSNPAPARRPDPASITPRREWESWEPTMRPAPPVRPAAVEDSPPDRPRPRSGLTEARRLAWETMREGRSTWLLLAVVGLVLPATVLIASEGRVNPTPIAVWNTLVALTAGVSVFGLENRAWTYRLLVHHGARPGVVWLAKMATWCVGLAMIWGPLGVLSARSLVPPLVPQEEWIPIVLTLPLTFAVAQLCGMVIRRGITAGVVALVVTLGLATVELGMVLARMMPVWGLAILPVALVGVSWAWSDDWLLDRPAPGRWFRLGSILAGVFAVLLGGYTGWRGWSIPDVGPIGPPWAWIATEAPLPPDRNAAELYREAGRRLDEIPASESDPQAAAADQDRKILELIRAAAVRPDCQFQRPERLTLLNGTELPPVRKLADRVIADAQAGLRGGDLGTTWDDIVVLLRMARHLGQGGILSPAMKALTIEKDALDLAIEWATAPGQTPERLHAALAAYRELPRMSPAAEVVRGEAVLTERSLHLPFDELQGPLLELAFGRNAARQYDIPIWAPLWIDLITTPWERARAVRINRHMSADAVRIASLERWQRPQGSRLDPELDQDRLSSPLAKMLFANLEPYLEADASNEAARRALVQVLALRAWQLQHQGRFPNRLEDLVPGELPSLPADPYTGRTFGYIPAAQSRWNLPGSPPEGSMGMGGMMAVSHQNESEDESPRTAPSPPPEDRLLYSAGPDGRDDRGSGDLVFPIPPVRDH